MENADDKDFSKLLVDDPDLAHLAAHVYSPDFTTVPLPFAQDEWVDADERMFHACFVILGQYVEFELGHFDPDSDLVTYQHRGYRLHSDNPNEITAIDLWLWYNQDLPALEADYEKDLLECYAERVLVKSGDQSVDLSNGEVVIEPPTPHKEPKYEHDHVELVKNEKLLELMRIRRSLWV